MQTRVITDIKKTGNRWQGIPAVEVTPLAKIFVAWFSGSYAEPFPGNTIYLQIGRVDKEFSCPFPIMIPQGMARVYDPTLWLAPDLSMWLIYNYSDPVSGEHDVRAIVCHEPDAPVLKWTQPRRLGFNVPFSFRINKPTVLKNGDWVMPVTWTQQAIKWNQDAIEKWKHPELLWDTEKQSWRNPETRPELDWFDLDGQFQAVAISSDKGTTWNLFGKVKAPAWALENMIVERVCGELVMYIRTSAGHIWQSSSFDGGKNWLEAKATDIVNPSSRFYIGKLRNGLWLFVNTPHHEERNSLWAYLSDDEGRSWKRSLLLDDRAKVSYPDVVEAGDDKLYIVYDRDRYFVGEVILSTVALNEIVCY
jgi:hypothetical protein